MNKFQVGVVTLALCASPAMAAEEHHPDQKSAPAKDAGMQMRMMQDNMLKMHEQMHKIMQATDPKERERLMQEHRSMMQEHMKMMSGMKGTGMTRGKGKGGAMGAPAGK